MDVKADGTALFLSDCCVTGTVTGRAGMFDLSIAS
jgi:hypothetical protein